MESSTSRKSRQKPHHSLPFVGRRKEIVRIQKSVFAGETVFISGKYGIGRTALVRHIAAANNQYWRFVFVDCSRNAADICRSVFLELLPEIAPTAKNLGYKWVRDRIARFEGRSYETVIVFDNIARLSAQKLDLLRYWKWHSGFQFIAITESFLPDHDLAKLHGCLGPASTVVLDRLPLSRGEEFFETCSQAYDLRLKPSAVRGLARAASGYPLSMTQLLASELKRRGLAAHS